MKKYYCFNKLTCDWVYKGARLTRRQWKKELGDLFMFYRLYDELEYEDIWEGLTILGQLLTHHEWLKAHIGE